MYSVNAKCESGFSVISETEGFEYLMDKEKKSGTTPVGYVVSALSGCALMCVRGFYIKKGVRDVSISAALTYDEKFLVNISIDKEVNEEEKGEIVSYINKNCTVSKMLNKEIRYSIRGK